MYQVLYRKYRPKVFDDVIGQNHVTSTLSNEVREGKLSHAYLFTGSRGTGKTTCARILAKAVNCLNPVDGNPCNECEICKGIDNGSVLDVIEIDAASNRGVDNIRDLRDEANFTPSKAKYRIYIIDEVHMLTIEAFNALLKTLEEPPEHVKFILATTEIHKLPATILSRCQRFDFRRISPEDISSRLQKVCEIENFTLEDDAAMLISRIADGGMRDALSLLDQCVSGTDVITVERVTSAAGLTNREYLYKLAESIKNKDCSSALKIVDELHNASCDMERLCTELVNHFRNLLIVKTIEKPEELIICTDDEFVSLKEQAKGFTLEKILNCLGCLEETAGNMKRGVNRRVEAEMALVRLCSPKLDNSVDSLIARISALENAISNGEIPQMKQKTVQEVRQESKPESPKPVNENVQKPQPTPTRQSEEPVRPTVEQNVEAPTSDVPFTPWADVLELISQRSKPLFGLLCSTTAVLRGECVGIVSNNAALGKFISENSYRNVILQAVYDVTGKKYRLGISHSKSNQPQNQTKKDPLDGLINKLQNSEIDFNIN